MSLFDSTVLVALITGVITAVSTLGATALSGHRAAQVERWRAEHALERERELRDHERGLAREREVRTRLEEVRGSVLRLDIGMRSIAQIRLHGPSRQGGDDLSELVRQARTDVFEAVIAVERMRDVLSPDGQDRVDDLRDAVDEALNHVQARTDRSAEQVHRDLASGLRALAEVVPAEWVLEAVAAPVVRSGGAAGSFAVPFEADPSAEREPE